MESSSPTRQNGMENETSNSRNFDIGPRDVEYGGTPVGGVPYDDVRNKDLVAKTRLEIDTVERIVRKYRSSVVSLVFQLMGLIIVKGA